MRTGRLCAWGRAGSARIYPTVGDFENIHRYLSGEGPRPKDFANYVSCFKTVDLRAGQEPQTGDIAAVPDHVVLVEGYNRRSGEIDTLEASSERCQGLCHLSRPIFEPACPGGGDNVRPIRADLRVLRYAPHAPTRPGDPPCNPSPLLRE